MSGSGDDKEDPVGLHIPPQHTWVRSLDTPEPSRSIHTFSRPPVMEALSLLNVAARVGMYISAERFNQREPIFDLNGYHNSLICSFLPLFLPSFVPSFLCSFLPLFLPSFLPSFLPTFLSTHTIPYHTIPYYTTSFPFLLCIHLPLDLCNLASHSGIALEPPNPGPYSGVPLGGLGGGNIGRGYRGDFRRW